nr:integrase, catalytic region, zinc finger, CCHC-type, peptidase aspartic, catalytic [Tanacetum cinerariifolium]
MILEFIENGPLIWPSIEENKVTRPKKYSELSATKAIQADCDVKATNIIPQGLPPEVYALYGSPYQSQQNSSNQSSTPLSITHTSNDYQSSVHNNTYSPPSLIFQIAYAPTVSQQQQPEFPSLDSGLTVLVFKQESTLLEKVEAIMGNKGLLFVTTIKGKDTCPNSALKLRGNRMIHDLRIKCCWDNSVSNQSAPSFDQLFKLNELKAQSQEKDTVIKKLKEIIKSLSGNMRENKIKKDLKEIETINIELDHMVSKLIAENEHLKQTYKQHYDSIKSARIRSKEQCDDLINQVNLKSVKIFNLNASLQEKVLRKVWKPTGKVFTNIGYTWRPTGRTFTIVGNACPLTGITITDEVPLREPTTLESDTPKPMGFTVFDVPSSSLNECMLSKVFSVKFVNDHVAKILGYCDYQIGNVMISRVYNVEGLGHNLFSVRLQRLCPGYGTDVYLI